MDLTTTYLGLELAHPIVPGAGPLADELDSVRRLEDAGAPVIQLRSLFEEQIASEQIATFEATMTPANSFAEALNYMVDPEDFVLGPQEYLAHLERVKATVDIPVIASLNGTTAGGWLEYARLIERCGADALELNAYELGTDPSRSGQDLENELLSIVAAIKRELGIPLAIKISPFYTSTANVASRLVEAGADALVIFNRFYQPDIDPVELETTPTLHLSHRSELLLRLRWLAVLSAQLDSCDLAVTGGVHSVQDAVKSLMCGATTVQMVSALLTQGPTHLAAIRDGVADWMEDNEYDSLSQMRGNMNLSRTPNPKAFERANYMRVLQSWEA